MAIGALVITLWHMLVAVSPLVEIGRPCTAKIKGEPCNDIARHHVHWPGSPAGPRCDACCAALKRIADALGFELWVEPLEVRRLDVGMDDASLRFAMMELT